jgi:hypothetical protein
VDGAQLAAVDTLQHGLAGDAESRGGDLDRDPACGGVVGDEIADRRGEADLPGSAGGDLLAGDESVVEPPVDLSWAILVRKSVGAVDGVEGLAQVVGNGVGGGDRLLAGLDLDLAVAAGGLDEFPG